MAMRKKTRRIRSKTGKRVTPIQREIKTFTKYNLLSRPITKKQKFDLRAIEDNRQQYRKKRQTIYGRPAKYAAYRKIVKPKTKQKRYSYDKIRFVSPRRVVVCIRRKIRQEVLFALGKTGKGSGGGPKRYNENSDIRC